MTDTDDPIVDLLDYPLLEAHRLDLPPRPPHMLPPNLWMANRPGSTLFMPVADASEELLGLLAMAMANGNLPVDPEAQRPAGNLAPFVRSGLLNEDNKVPITLLQQMAYEANCSEVDFMAHNMVLTMQAMGLGGLFLSGLNRWSVLGAFADEGVTGLGFRFVENPSSPLPDPVGLDGHYEALCPPYHPDMRSAVETSTPSSTTPTTTTAPTCPPTRSTGSAGTRHRAGPPEPRSCTGCCREHVRTCAPAVRPKGCTRKRRPPRIPSGIPIVFVDDRISRRSLRLAILAVSSVWSSQERFGPGSGGFAGTIEAPTERGRVGGLNRSRSCPRSPRPFRATPRHWDRAASRPR